MMETTLTDFLTMGGYAAYVWGSFALSFAVIIANILAAKRLRRRVLSDISAVSSAAPKTFSESTVSESSLES